jgi:hypothetical protein
MTDSASVGTEVLETRLKAVEAAVAVLAVDGEAQRKHRTRVETLLGVVGACAVIIGVGAMNVRDSVTRLEAGASARDARLSELETHESRRDSDDRATSAAIIRLQTTMETLQSTIAQRLDALDRRLASSPPR